LTGNWPPQTAIAVNASRDVAGMQRAKYPPYQSRPRRLLKNPRHTPRNGALRLGQSGMRSTQREVLVNAAETLLSRITHGIQSALTIELRRFQVNNSL
jgi:hypothetical protein